MSRAQSSSREQMLTLNLLADKIVQVIEAVHLKNQMQKLQIDRHINQSGQIDRFKEEIPENLNPETAIKTYSKTMHLIPEFDGLNVKVFIGHIQVVAKRLIID